MILHKIKFLGSIIVMIIGLVAIGISAQTFITLESLAPQSISSIDLSIEKPVYDEPFVSVSWMNHFEIRQTDSDPLVPGNNVGFHAYVNTNEIPQELVIHIFHEDMKDYFLGTADNDFKSLASKLNRIPAVKFLDSFSIEFQLTEEPTPSDGSYHYDLNEFNLDVTLKKPGTYFGQISVKTEDGEIDHYATKSSIMKVHELQESSLQKSINYLVFSKERESFGEIRAFGIAVLAMGFGILFSGLNLLYSSITNNMILKGETGDKGPKGDKGETGDKGSSGDRV